MGGILLELFEEFLGRRPHNIMNLVYLVKFVVTWKKGVERQKFDNHKGNCSTVLKNHLQCIPTIAVHSYKTTSACV